MACSEISDMLLSSRSFRIISVRQVGMSRPSGFRAFSISIE